MSHFTRIRTQMVVLSHIKQAVEDLGYKCQLGNLEIRGYNGQRTSVELKVPTNNAGYDIGFRKVGESYEMVADWWGIRDINQRQFLTEVTQRYACNATKEKLQEQGFDLVTEEVQRDGRIHLTLRRLA